MDTAKIKNCLEVATNAAVLLVAVVVLSAIAVNFFSKRSAPPQKFVGLQKGQQISSLDGITFGNSEHTLLIAMNTRCTHCTASIPFYNQIAELKDKSKSSLQVIGAFPNPSDEVRQYVTEHQLKIQSQNSVDFTKLRIMGTPTIFLVDSGGHILDVWIGELDSKSQQKVLQSLASL